MTEVNTHTQPLTALYRPAESAPATWAMGSLFEQLLSSADSGGSLGMSFAPGGRSVRGAAPTGGVVPPWFRSARFRSASRSGPKCGVSVRDDATSEHFHVVAPDP